MKAPRLVLVHHLQIATLLMELNFIFQQLIQFNYGLPSRTHFLTKGEAKWL